MADSIREKRSLPAVTAQSAFVALTVQPDGPGAEFGVRVRVFIVA